MCELLAADSANKSIVQHCLITIKIRLRTEAPKALTLLLFETVSAAQMQQEQPAMCRVESA